MNDAEREIVERYQSLARPDDDGLVHTDHVEPLLSLIESQAQQLGNLLAVIHGDGGHHTDDVGEQQSIEDAEARWGDRTVEIERHREAALESTGLAGERIGTIAALRHEVADQAERIEELERKRTSTEGDVDTLTDAVGLPRGVGYEELLASVIRLREAAVAKTGQPGPTT